MGRTITPNQHKLALQFGVLDNFYDSGEVSGDGHVWSTAAIGTDYLEKTWQQNYRGSQRTYDFEGVVAEGYPLLQKIPDVNEPCERISVGQPGAAWKDALPLWRVHLVEVLRCEEEWRIRRRARCWRERAARSPRSNRERRFLRSGAAE